MNFGSQIFSASCLDRTGCVAPRVGAKALTGNRQGRLHCAMPVHAPMPRSLDDPRVTSVGGATPPLRTVLDPALRAVPALRVAPPTPVTHS